MDQSIERKLLIVEIQTMIQKLRDMGSDVIDDLPVDQITSDSTTLPILHQVKRELRDVLRTVGGARQ